MSDVAERVKKIVVEHLAGEARSRRRSFIDDQVRTPDTVELVMAFEEEFDAIPMMPLRSRTVKDAISFIQEHA